MSIPTHWRLRTFGGYAGRGATSERVKDHISFVGTGLDDAFKQRQGLLGWIARAFFGGHSLALVEAEGKTRAPMVINHTYDVVLGAGGAD